MAEPQEQQLQLEGSSRLHCGILSAKSWGGLPQRGLGAIERAPMPRQGFREPISRGLTAHLEAPHWKRDAGR